MKVQPTALWRPPESPPDFGVRQSSAAIPPGTVVLGRSAKAPEDWRTSRRWRDCQRSSWFKCGLRRGHSVEPPHEPVGAPTFLSASGDASAKPTGMSALQLHAFSGANHQRRGGNSLPCAVLFTSLAFAAWGALTVCGAELRIGQTNASAGTVANVPVTFDSATGAAAAQFDFSYDSSLVSLTGVSGGSALAGHVVDYQQLASGPWRALVYSPTNGPIATGAVVWLSFNIPPNTPDGVVPLAVANAIVAKPAGQRVQPLAQVSGALTVSSPRDVLTITLAGKGQLCTTVSGVPGRTFTLQGTPDFFHWADLGSYTNQTGTLVLTNFLRVGRDLYFYRTLFQPPTTPYAFPAPNLSGVAMLTNGRTTFQLNSTAGSAWRVEGSPDLVHWGNYGVVTNQSGTIPITNTPFGKPRDYFYRAAQP